MFTQDGWHWVGLEWRSFWWGGHKMEGNGRGMAVRQDRKTEGDCDGLEGRGMRVEGPNRKIYKLQ